MPHKTSEPREAEALKQVHVPWRSQKAPRSGVTMATSQVLSYVRRPTLTQAVIPARVLQVHFEKEKKKKKKIKGVSEILSGPETSLL